MMNSHIKKLEKASASYYSGNPIMTDLEFDTAIAQLRKNEPGHPFLKRVGAPVPGTLKAKHAIPMGSLSNANNEKEFRAWIPKNQPTIHLTHKLDGSSLELVYENGHFVRAITRGDGKVGEDVTRNVILSPHFPKEIDPAITSVRCECLIHKDDWEKYFKGDANPRNSAAGTLRRHNGKNAEHLQFYAFDALIDMNIADENMIISEADGSEHEMLDILSEWFLVPHYFSSSSIENLISWYKETEKIRDAFEYEIDGIVAKIDDREKSQEMGIRDGRPKGQIAIKFAPRGGETVLREVVWQVGHTGALTPVGKVDPVTVGGTSIRRVTLCNMDEIERLGIRIGDAVEIIRAGDVIPKLSKLIRNGKNRQRISFPLVCPECSHRTIRDGARIFCRNEKCGGQALGRVMTWIKKRNILNLGVGVVRAAGIHSICDLYTMVEDDWADVQVKNGVFGLKRATKIMASLEQSRHQVSISEFFGSIGIKGVGRSLMSTLCDRFDLEAVPHVLVLLPEQIEKLEGFGTIRAYDFCSWLQKHREEVEELASFMDFESGECDMNEDQVFSGETICFTGRMDIPREEMIKLANRLGAATSNSVTSKTTILVVSDPNSVSKKTTKAKTLGVRLLSVKDFFIIMNLNL